MLQAAREAKPFYLGALAAIEPTRYVCKSSTSWDGPGGDSANSGTRRDIPQSPGCASLALSVLAEVASVRLHQEEDHACPRRPDPCGRAWEALSHLGGNTHKCIGWRQSPEVAPYPGHLKKTGELSTLRLNRRLR